MANQQAAQAALVSNLGDPVEAAWSFLDVNNLESSLPGFVKALLALTHRFGTMSSTIAARAYLAERSAAGVKGKFTVLPAPKPAQAKVDESVRWATRELWSKTPDVEASKTNVSGVMDRLVLDQGRHTFLGAVQADRRAKG